MPKSKIAQDRYLIIGSNSFSGASFINLLLNKKYNVAGISRSKELNKIFSPYFKNKNIRLFKFKRIDITKNHKKMMIFLKKFKPTIIVNYAAQGMVDESWINPEDWYRTNLLSQSILYRNLSKLNFIKKFIHVTTPEVYGNIKKPIKENFNFFPTTPYAISRAAMDMHLLNFYKYYKLPVLFTRTSNIYGPFQPLYRIIPKALICAKTKIKFNLHGGGNSIRSFIFSEDVSRATYLISQKGKIGESYHISNSNFISIKNLVKKVSKLQNVSFKNLCKVSVDRVGKDYSYKLNFKKLTKLGWKPKVSLNNGLIFTAKWIDENLKYLSKTDLYYKHKR